MDVKSAIMDAVSKMKKGRPSTKSDLDKIYMNVKKTVKGGRGPSNHTKILDLMNDRIMAVEREAGELSRADIEKLFKRDLLNYKKLSSKPKKEIKPKKEKVIKEKVIKPKKEKVIKEKVIKEKVVGSGKPKKVKLPQQNNPIPVVVENPFTGTPAVVKEIDPVQFMPISEPDKPFVSLDKRPSVKLPPSPLQKGFVPQDERIRKPKGASRSLSRGQQKMYKLNMGYQTVMIPEEMETRYM
jgi:hypothetical protein